MLDMLPGKKTYVLIAGLILYKLTEVYTGTLPMEQFIDYLFGGGLLAAVKAGWERNKP